MLLVVLTRIGGKSSNHSTLFRDKWELFPDAVCLHQKLHQPISARALVFNTDCHRSSRLTFRGALSLPNGGFKDKSTVVGNKRIPSILLSVMMEMLDFVSKKENNVQILRSGRRTDFVSWNVKEERNCFGIAPRTADVTATASLLLSSKSHCSLERQAATEGYRLYPEK